MGGRPLGTAARCHFRAPRGARPARGSGIISERLSPLGVPFQTLPHALEVDSPAFARAAELLLKAATSAPFEGRAMYAPLRAIPIPEDVVTRLFHAASLLREHRGDGHIAALLIERVGGLEAHVLFALDLGMPAERFGRIHHLPAAQLAAVIDEMRDRRLIGDDGWLSEQGRAVKQRVEALTDEPRGVPRFPRARRPERALAASVAGEGGGAAERRLGEAALARALLVAATCGVGIRPGWSFSVDLSFGFAGGGAVSGPGALPRYP